LVNPELAFNAVVAVTSATIALTRKIHLFIVVSPLSPIKARHIFIEAYYFPLKS
jgi:hypothetical protein